MQRQSPNVLVTGTPGVGKSTFSRMLARWSDLEWLEVSSFAVSNECVTGEPDPVYKSYILNEDKLLDILEEKLKHGGYIVDHHGSDLFPVRWFDFVVVLIVGNTVLHDRLVSRGYSGRKLEDNIDCEIFQTVLEDVRSSFTNEIVHVFTNVTHEELRLNIQTLTTLINDWKLTAADTPTESSASTTSPDTPESIPPHSNGNKITEPFLLDPDDETQQRQENRPSNEEIYAAIVRAKMLGASTTNDDDLSNSAMDSTVANLGESVEQSPDTTMVDESVTEDPRNEEPCQPSKKRKTRR